MEEQAAALAEQTIEIRKRWTGDVIFSHTGASNSIAITVGKAIDSGADMSGTNLRCANLRCADMSGTNLRCADMSGTNLSGADMSGTNLRCADMSGADMSGTNLSGADMSGTNLRCADMSGANLSGTNLSGANLSGTNLRCADMSGTNLSDADLTPVRDDIWAVLSSAPGEVPAVIEALKAGRVDGSTYEGECSCLVGTIAGARETTVSQLGSLKPNSSRPAERFFMGIRRGDTPETSQFSKLALEWAEEWLANMRAAFVPAVE